MIKTVSSGQQAHSGKNLQEARELRKLGYKTKTHASRFKSHIDDMLAKGLSPRAIEKKVKELQNAGLHPDDNIPSYMAIRSYKKYWSVEKPTVNQDDLQKIFSDANKIYSRNPIDTHEEMVKMTIDAKKDYDQALEIASKTKIRGMFVQKAREHYWDLSIKLYAIEERQGLRARRDLPEGGTSGGVDGSEEYTENPEEAIRGLLKIGQDYLRYTEKYDKTQPEGKRTFGP